MKPIKKPIKKTMMKGLSDIYDSSDWEKLSSHLPFSSSSDDEEDEHPCGEKDWFIVKNKKPKHEEEDDEGDDDDDTNMTVFYDNGGEEKEKVDNWIFARELLLTYLPELVDNEKFSLEYVEQHFFPHLPTKTLLHLKSTSSRWTRWISSDFFVHTHSLVSRSTVSGLFFHDSLGSPSFASFDDVACSIPTPLFSFLPEQVLVKSSNHGLVCCRGKETLNYYVCNPTTFEWAPLPRPVNEHSPDTAVVIVMKEPLTYNFSTDYFVVCAYEIVEGVYGFESFSSEIWEWKGSDEIADCEKIVPGSGVAASGLACWRTTMRNLVLFDPVVGAWQAETWSAGADGDTLWEIGELGRKLCIVSLGEVIASSTVEVRVFKDGRWLKKAEERDMEVNWSVVPLRAQGEREVMVWDSKNRTVMAWDVERGTERRLDQPGYCADFLPYLSSLVHVRGSQKNGKQNFDRKGKGVKISQE